MPERVCHLRVATLQVPIAGGPADDVVAEVLALYGDVDALATALRTDVPAASGEAHRPAA